MSAQQRYEQAKAKAEKLDKKVYEIASSKGTIKKLREAQIKRRIAEIERDSLHLILILEDEIKNNKAARE